MSGLSGLDTGTTEKRPAKSPGVPDESEKCRRTPRPSEDDECRTPATPATRKTPCLLPKVESRIQFLRFDFNSLKRLIIETRQARRKATPTIAAAVATHLSPRQVTYAAHTQEPWPATDPGVGGRSARLFGKQAGILPPATT